MRGRRLIFPALAAGLAAALWGFWLEPARVTIREHRLELAGWPEALSGLRVALLTDLHIGALHMTPEKLDRIVALTNQAEAEMIVLAGDYVAGRALVGASFVAPEAIAPALARLRAPLGVWSVLGNHDRLLGPARMAAAFTAHDLALIEDRAVKIARGNADFWLLGISDFYTGPHDFARALEAVPAGAPVVALTHSPDIFPELPRRIILTLAGHTHGGQVYLPFLGRLVVPSRYGQRYARGFVLEKGHAIFVGSGLGTTLLPVRFLTPPEISLVTIVRGEGGDS